MQSGDVNYERVLNGSCRHKTANTKGVFRSNDMVLTLVMVCVVYRYSVLHNSAFRKVQMTTWAFKHDRKHSLRDYWIYMLNTLFHP